MRATLATLAALTFLVSAPGAQTRPSRDAKTFDFYVIDVEGGAASLFMTPAGESIMIDSGNPGARDLDRIMAVLGEVGVKEIDYLISTHYHVDHIGGMQELAKRVPIKHYVDHGPSSEEREQVAGFQAAYAELYGKAKHTVVKPGDKLPIAGLDWRIVTAGGKAIKTALPGGGKPNPSCADFKRRDANPLDENGQSVGSVITFGKFRMIDLGDLLWNNEFDFMCPNNLIGHRRPLHRVSPRHRPVGIAGARAWAAAARGDLAERHAEGRHAPDVADAELVAELPGPLADALVL